MLICILYAGCAKQDKPIASSYPIAIDLSKVGTYSALTKSGAGYFYDEVLEYRVWIHPDGDDSYEAFATFEEAEVFSKKHGNAEEPLVLVLQREHINEPKPGEFEHVKGNRITEWRVEWLKGQKRAPNSIELFLKAKTKN